MEIVLFLVLIPVARGLIYFSDWRYLAKACNKHRLYLTGASTTASSDAKMASGNASEWLTENLTEIKTRVKKSGVDDPVYSFMEPKGYGYLGETRMSTLDNLLYLNETVQQNVITVLKRSRGYFKIEAIKSFNPLFWLETLFFLPKAIVSASGIDTSSKVADIALKVAQVIYWIVIVGAVVSDPSLLRVLIENFKT